MDARAIEGNDIPRLSKRGKPSEKLLDIARVDNSALRSAKSREIQRERLKRRRTKFRDAYLKHLQELGKYDPTRPVKPDPERYIFSIIPF